MPGDATVIASVTGYLNGWIDFNNDGDWADAGEQIYTIYANSDQNRPQVAIATAGGPFAVSGTSRLPLSTWTHLAGTYDGSTLRLYVNGNQVAAQTVSAAIRTSTAPLRIGGNSIFGQFFRGRIDEVRIYNRALTPSEVQTVMNTPLQ
jgi:hypothetical protein